MESDRMTVDEDDHPPSTGTQENMPHIEWTIQTSAWQGFLGDIKEQTTHAMQEAIKAVIPSVQTIEVSLVLADDAFIQDLNKQYRGKDKPTNVLSFPQFDSLSDIENNTNMPTHLGDIVLSFETIAREAKEQNKEIVAHTLHMITHGFLHLLGFDHLGENQANEMEALEKTILKQLNISDPYEL